MGSSSISQFKKCIVGLLSLVASTLFAAEISLGDEDNWIFSGMVSNEKGDQYAYFFQMQHQGVSLKSAVTLFDMQSKEPVFQEEAVGLYQMKSPYHWEIGHTFLHFNPITGSWVFGLKTKEKQGFNFKIDMMNAYDPPVLEERLRPGLRVTLNHVKALNGHIYLSKRHDEFVTARHAWLRQMTVLPQTIDNAAHLVSGVLCHFNDDSGFYAMKLPERDALQGAIAGRFDSEGQMHTMSQFVDIQQTADGVWDIRALLPQYHVTLSHAVDQNSITSGFVTHAQSPGFCVLSRDVFKVS